mmetsp:Transcript_93038/g.240416  ORF Transcript_93038/g.240416 Transcript_93038/m.240416 type:complete len:223 (+) Transcript_93038:522-1190(+)
MAAASAPGLGSGRSTLRPTPRATALRLFTIWSPKAGHTSTGTALDSPSMKLFWPPWVRKRSTPALSTSTCGTEGMQIAFGGTSRPSSASGCGPRDTTRSAARSAPSSSALEPNASKAPPQAFWQSPLPLRPLGCPSAPSARPFQPICGTSPVTTVPMLTRTMRLPARRAARTFAMSSEFSALTSAGASDSPPCCSNLCGPLRFAPILSSSAPTYSKRTPRPL